MKLRRAPYRLDRLEETSYSLPPQPPPTTEAQRPRKQWAQKRNFKNAKPGRSLEILTPEASHWSGTWGAGGLLSYQLAEGWKGFPRGMGGKQNGPRVT